MRLFIAVNPDIKQKEALIILQEELKLYFKNTRWVDSEGLHLTLKFLGETNYPIKKIERALKDSLEFFKPFKMSLNGIGIFPDLRRPRIIWAGVSEGKDVLTAISKSINKNLNEIVAFDNKPFLPHITLGRIKKAENKTEINSIISSLRNFSTATTLISCVELYESKLLHDKAYYRSIKKYILI